MEGEHDRRARRLREVEVVDKVAQDGNVLAHSRTWVWTPIGCRVEALAVQEIVFDELQIGIEAERLVVNVAFSGVGADDEAGDAQAIAVFIDRRRNNVVVETAPI